MPQKRRTTPSASRSQATGGGARRPWVTWTVVGIGVVAIVVLIVFIAGDVTSNPQGEVTPPEGVETFEVASAAHTTDAVEYPQDPPVGGPHDATPLACGIYDTPVRNENAVHSLEHGAVWITYQPDLDAADVADLDAFGRQSEVIVSPYPGLDSPVVLSSWGTQLRLSVVDTDVIDQFIRAFKNQTAPEAAATC